VWLPCKRMFRSDGHCGCRNSASFVSRTRPSAAFGGSVRTAWMLGEMQMRGISFALATAENIRRSYLWCGAGASLSRQAAVSGRAARQSWRNTIWVWTFRAWVVRESPPVKEECDPGAEAHSKLLGLRGAESAALPRWGARFRGFAQPGHFPPLLI
jgi:hypothetical protein